jgi:hypothetical protein
MTATDLICCYAARRVLPLQSRAHKICHMSGQFDPTRTSKLDLSAAGVARRVNYVSQAKLSDDWQWGMEPFCRDDPPPLVSFSRVGPAVRLVAALAGLLLPLLACSPAVALLLVPYAEIRVAGGRGRGPSGEGVDA